jgi:UDP-N-acetylmuramate-alanine ligase
VFWTPSLEDAERALDAELREGDLLLTLGAGDVDRLAAALVTEAGPPAITAAGEGGGPP